MQILIDINEFAAVFEAECKNHSKFKDINDWINDKGGALIFGGKKYKRELQATTKYLKIFNLLKSNGQVIQINDLKIDSHENLVKQLTLGKDCDDQHLISILAISNCDLICSLDRRAYPFLKDKNLYLAGNPKVKIYSSAKNKNLLKKCDDSKVKNRCK